MFRIWGKIWKDNHLLQDITICDAATDKNRTAKYLMRSKRCVIPLI